MAKGHVKAFRMLYLREGRFMALVLAEERPDFLPENAVKTRRHQVGGGVGCHLWSYGPNCGEGTPIFGYSGLGGQGRRTRWLGPRAQLTNASMPPTLQERPCNDLQKSTCFSTLTLRDSVPSAPCTLMEAFLDA